MKFAIRDDDTCYFTSPEDLKSAYGDMWGKVPISLAVIPFVKARKAPFIPKEYQNSGREYPIGENHELVSFIEKEVRKGNVSIMLHGYNHEYYPQPEFVAGKNLTEKVKQGKQYLEEVFGVEIKTFVPPSNKISAEGFKAVKKCGMNLLYYPTPLGRPFGIKKWLVFFEDLLFKYKESKDSTIGFIKNCYKFWVKKNREVFMPMKPFTFEIDGVREFNCVSLVDATPVDNVLRNIDIACKYDANFCLALHYHAFKRRQFKKKFRETLDYINKLPNVEFVHVDDVFKGDVSENRDILL